MDPAGVVALVRRRWLVIAICTLIGLAGATLVTQTTPKSYRASARLFVNIPAARGVQEALQGVQLSSQLLESYSQIATSRSVALRVSDRLDERFGAGEIRAKLTAEPRPETLLIDITATDGDPAGAATIANAAAEVMTEVIDELEAGDAGAVGARIIDRAVPPSGPVTPRRSVDLSLGLVLGLGAGMVLATILQSLDRSITTIEQATASYRAPVFASVPRARKEAASLAAMEGLASAAGEAYRSLRTSLRFAANDQEIRSVVVSSAAAGAGKSTVAANLAVAIAQAGERVIVIDADLRRPSLNNLFGIPGVPGLTEVVSGRVSLADALVPWRAGLSVLAPGALPPNPSEILGSEAMAELLDTATAMADVVVIDTTPILPVTDAVVLASLADGVLIVSRWGQTETADAEECRFILDSVGANVIGVALNGVRGNGDRTYYRDYASEVRIDERNRS